MDDHGASAVAFVVRAVAFVARYGHRFLVDYDFDPTTGPITNPDAATTTIAPATTSAATAPIRRTRRITARRPPGNRGRSAG